MEAVAKSGSPDALTLALEHERQKARENWDQIVEPEIQCHMYAESSKKRVRRRIRNDGGKRSEESSHDGRSARFALREDQKKSEENNSQGGRTRFSMQYSPLQRSSSRADDSTPGGTLTTGSEVSEESSRRITRRISAKARQGVGYVKTLFRKTKPSQVPRTVETVMSSGNDSIFRDLDVHSIGTSTVRHRNTKKIVVRPDDPVDPSIILAKARRYKLKAQHLVRKAEAANGKAKEEANRVDPRDVEALARKAYRYAAESRRLFDLARTRIEVEKSEVSVASEAVSFDTDIQTTTARNPNRSKVGSSKGSIAKAEYSAPVWDDDVSVYTTFSQKVERDEHKRKMKELELFGEVDFGPFTCGGSDQLGQQYARETKSIVRSIQETGSFMSDSMSVMSPETVVSSETTVTENFVRRDHAERMKELELFTPSNTIESWKAWIQSPWEYKNTLKQEIRSDVMKSCNVGSHYIGTYCGPSKYPQVFQDDFDTRLRYRIEEDDVSGQGESYDDNDECDSVSEESSAFRKISQINLYDMDHLRCHFSRRIDEGVISAQEESCDDIDEDDTISDDSHFDDEEESVDDSVESENEASEESDDESSAGSSYVSGGSHGIFMRLFK